MVRSGARPGQVLSSGKHTRPTKLTNGKKGTHLRKISHINPDSACPVHSDSESQTETIQGLDGCASLLRDIMRNEDSGSEIAYSENKCIHRHLEDRRYGTKKKGHEKLTVPLVVRKEMLSSKNKKQIPSEVSARIERDLSDTAQNWSFQDHYRMYSPIIYQALCEHVQTQMSLTNNLSAKSNSASPAVSFHTVSSFESQVNPQANCGVSTSTPAQLLQQPPYPPMVHSAVQTDSDYQFLSKSKTMSVNYNDFLKNSFSVDVGAPYRLPKTDKPVLQAHQLDFINGTLPQGVPSEPDLQKCFQTYMNLLCSQEQASQSNSQTHQSSTLLESAFLATNEEQCGEGQSGEITSDGKDLNAHVQNSRIKDVQKAKDVNQSTEKIRTIKYLLGELKALVAEQEDTEIQRLIIELETCISLLPIIKRNTNVQVEIALAMQPLRSENAQLRRQLRILNQQLREQKKTPKATGSMECNLELFSLQSLNKSLQNQLQESLKSQELLQRKNEELLKVIENQKDENKKFADVFKEKDQTLLEKFEEALVNVKSSQFKLEAAEKENQILGITLRQRDAEVTRLRELTRTLQSSMAKLLSDLSVDSTRCKPGNNLTKSLLNIHEKLQYDPVPIHTSIMSYLNKLETDNMFTHSEPLSTVNNEENTVPSRSCEDILPSKGSQHSRSTEELSPPGIISTLSKNSDEEIEVMTLVEDECNLDNTIYIPFARSTPDKKPLSKRLSPQSHSSVNPSHLISNSGLAISEKENTLCVAGVCSFSKKEAEDTPEKLSRAADLEDKQLLKKIKEVIGKIPSATEKPEDLAVQLGPSVCPGSNTQVKNRAISEGSFLNSDLMSDWSISSFSTFTSRDEQDFRSGLAALDANIARLQESLKTDFLEK
ncbi:coiled-coil domain-containing protein 14 isoform X2 [Erinaceus europaeus]|uniref:Coiled-coil domain-containing protein 14 isoform X2 n=1 Tax=Erinaceus europaeus TaxID=9365 RepID=A0ABM3XZJ5_ERIEU|nr:coiled-coil domain-containing protein 14 isoform X2 [Erinaceus europaeus]